MIYIVIGVSGVGKTTIGKTFAEKQNIDFIDADDFHPTENVEKMENGTPLNDEDRQPWLLAINKHLKSITKTEHIVLACSALKETYRKLLSQDIESKVRWIVLNGDFDLIANRMKQRNHFMPPELLQSQFDDFEIPSYGIHVDVAHSIEEILNQLNEEILMKQKAEFGLVGLGVMGKSLARNIAQKGFHINLYNRHVTGKEEHVAKRFIEGHSELKDSDGFDDLNDFVISLERPRKVMLMVNAGSAVDEMINKLSQLLDKDDVIIDGGNSFYKDTERRHNELLEQGIHYIGAGVSGGEAGALKGPSIMPGGSEKGYEQAGNILQTIAAKDRRGNSCCAFIGKAGAGHFVKMVHNGIEYGEMQLIAEIYGILRFQLDLSLDAISTLFADWNKTDCANYLLEITSKILLKKEENTPLVDLILDKAGNKGTGSWTTIAACELGVPIPTITAALFARYQSAQYDLRQKGAMIYKESAIGNKLDVGQLKLAYQQARIINHHQGFDLISAASSQYGWDINLSELSRVWTNGCIIRSELMEQIAQSDNMNQTILSNAELNKPISSDPNILRTVVGVTSQSSMAIPCLSSASNYLNAFGEKRSLANIIQAQRDFFGAHTYERIDAERGQKFHTEWE